MFVFMKKRFPFGVSQRHSRGTGEPVLATATPCSLSLSSRGALAAFVDVEKISSKKKQGGGLVGLVIAFVIKKHLTTPNLAVGCA
jgi:hypothetical protein